LKEKDIKKRERGMAALYNESYGLPLMILQGNKKEGEVLIGEG